MVPQHDDRVPPCLPYAAQQEAEIKNTGHITFEVRSTVPLSSSAARQAAGTGARLWAVEHTAPLRPTRPTLVQWPCVVVAARVGQAPAGCRGAQLGLMSVLV